MTSQDKYKKLMAITFIQEAAREIEEHLSLMNMDALEHAELNLINAIRSYGFAIDWVRKNND